MWWSWDGKPGAVEADAASVTGNEAQIDRHEVFERVSGWAAGVRRDRLLRERLEVQDVRIPPPAGFLLLDAEKRSGFVEALGIDEPLEATPDVFHAADRLDAAAVAGGQLVPQRPAGGQPIGPRHVVEPEQVVIGDAIETGKTIANGSRILTDGVRAACRAIEAETLRIGAIVVDRCLVGARSTGDPRARTVMMPACHLVVQPERRHVIDSRLP